jgi:predicted small metal-binding protein
VRERWDSHWRRQEKEETGVRALLCGSVCNCRRRLSGADDEQLVSEVLDHLRRDHPTIPLGEEWVREIVFARAYELEYAAVYKDGQGPDEEFGPEPYWGPSMTSEEARIGMRVRVREDHRITEVRGKEGTIVGSYGQSNYMALDVRFPDGRCRLFWAGDLEEISALRLWWRSLLGKG